MLHVTDLKIGDSFEKKILITKQLHDKFADLSQDHSPIHTSPEFSRKSNFKSPIGYAFLITSLLSGIYGMHFPGGSELCLTQNCSFTKEYYVGDELTFSLIIKTINESQKLIQVDTTVTNQDHNVIFKGNAIMLLSLG